MIHAIGARVSVVLIGLALGLAACGGNTPSVEPTKVTFLMDFLVSGWHAPVYAGVAQGFFADQGIDVTVEPGQGSVDGATKVAANVAQFAQIDAVSALNAMASGGDLVLIGVIDQAYPGGLCYIGERTKIDGYGDLTGLRIGASAGDAYLVPLPGLVNQAGYDPEIYEHITMTPPNYTAALFAKEIDAYACSRATFIPGEAAAASEGLTLKMFRYADTGFQPIGHTLVVNGELVRTDPALVQRFVYAWAYSHVWAWANPDAAMDLFTKVNPSIDRGIAMKTLLDRELSYAAGNEFFTFDRDKLAAVVDFVNEAYDAKLVPDSVYKPESVDALPVEIRDGKLPAATQ